MQTKVLKCGCSNEGQDKIYGVGNRLHNYATNKSTKGGMHIWRCTVCLETRASGHMG